MTEDGIENYGEGGERSVLLSELGDAQERQHGEAGQLAIEWASKRS